MVQPEGNLSLKNPVTPPGIDPGTVQLVVQRLNHYAIPGPYHSPNASINYISTCITEHILSIFMKGLCLSSIILGVRARGIQKCMLMF